MRSRTVVFALALSVLLASGLLLLRPARPMHVTVMLDYLPNPNHVPLYAALEHGFFRGLDVDVLVPGDASAPARLAAAGAVDFALTPQINYLIGRDEGLPLRAVAALIGSPLGGLLALRGSGVSRLEDLRGGRIGYSLEPLEPALWRTMLASAGLREGEFELVNVGVSTLPALLGRHVDAIGAFRNFEALQARLLGEEAVFFPEEEYGVPWTYELILVTSAEAVATQRRRIAAVVSALAEGIAFTREHPDVAFAAFLHTWPDLDDELDRQAYRATLPLYAPGARHDEAEVWRALQVYLVERGITRTVLQEREAYTDAFLGPR